MHDTLWVNDHFEAIWFQAEEPMCFDQFEAFVSHRCGIDCDFRPHRPVGMLGGISWCDAGESSNGRVAKLSARRGEDKLVEMLQWMALEALKDGVVFAVGREKAHAFALGCFNNEGSTEDEQLFVGERNVLAGFDGCEGRLEPTGPSNGD